MKLHEYQAKELFKRAGIAVPKGATVSAPEEIEAAVNGLGGNLWVVKAQVLTGGRGKAGGVKLCRSKADAIEAAKQLLGSRLVTYQSGPAGVAVNRVLIAEAVDIKREYYFGMVADRKTSSIAAMASSEGGMEIEEVARSFPEKIIKANFLPSVGLMPFQANRLALEIGLTGDAAKAAAKIFVEAAKLFVSLDASLLEINPLCETKDGQIVAVDAKINVDDNAGYRQTEIAQWQDTSETDPNELEAAKYGLNYIKLDGSIGCLVNGAGLAMATMDTIRLYGAAPANFLDVGGGATEEVVAAAFKILLNDKDVKAVLVNIFGGIMRCDVIAKGIVGALSQMELKVPLVVRLAGTNVDEGKRILAQSGIPMESAETIADAASKAAAAVNRV